MREERRLLLLSFLKELCQSGIGSLVRGDPNSLYMNILNKFPSYFKRQLALNIINYNIEIDKYNDLDQIISDLQIIAENCSVISQNYQLFTDNTTIQKQLKMFNIVSDFLLNKIEKFNKKMNITFENQISFIINKINQIFSHMPSHLRQISSFSSSIFSIKSKNDQTDNKKRIPFEIPQSNKNKVQKQYQCPFLPNKNLSRQVSTTQIPNVAQKEDNIQSKPFSVPREQSSSNLMKRVASKGISRQNSVKFNNENDTSINDNANSDIESLDSPIQENPNSKDDKNVEINTEYSHDQWLVQNEPMISDFEEDLPEDFRIPDQPLQPKYKIVKRVKKTSSQSQNQSTCRKKVFYGKSIKKGYGKVSSKTAAYFTATFDIENDPEKSDDSEYEFFSCSEDELPPKSQPIVQLPPRKFSIPSKLCILQNLPNQPTTEAPPVKRSTRVILFDRDEFALSDDDNSSDSDHDDYITHSKGPGRPRKNKDSYPPPHTSSSTGKPKGKPGRKPKEKTTEPKEPKEPKSTKKLGRSEIIVSTEDEELFCLNLTRAQEFMAEKQRIKLAKKMRRILVNQGEEADFSGQEPEINMETISNHTKYMLIKVLRAVFLDNGQEY